MLGPLTDADLDRRRRLRRMKAVATGLFIAAGVVYIVARANQDHAAWVGYVRATAEAAMVGALADWFAVTALFRHPLGLPIPHTAIIPKRKAEIGRSLGEFVQGNFLTPATVTGRLADVNPGKRVGVWLADPDNARRAGDVVADALHGVTEMLDDREVEAALSAAVERRLRETPVAPLLATAIDVALEGDHLQRMLDGTLKGVAGFLWDNREALRDRLDQESPWWVPEAIDERVFVKIFNAVQNFLADVAKTPDHELRSSIDQRVRALAVRLRDDAELIAMCERAKVEVLEHPAVQEWLGSLWGELKRSTLAAARDRGSDLRVRIDHALERAGTRLATDVEVQEKVERWVERVVVYVVEHYHGELTELISSTVERWDAADTSRRIELQVGRDLQFIRINGTVIGALAGFTIHLVSELWL